MEQATEPTTTAAPAEVRTPDPQRLAFQHTHMVSGDIVHRLAVQPFAVEIEEDFPSGWRVHLKFRSHQTAGLLDFARLVSVPVTHAVTEFGMHVECLARIGDVELRASALLSQAAAAALTKQSPTVHLSDQEGDRLTWPTEQPGDAPQTQEPGPTTVVPLNQVTAESADAEPDTISFAPAAPHAGGDR
ncbi:hypothetical protein [Streptomyces ipomoeae]|uniref:hypothetical protein n=1 Tax=Streptomyces ipomoeae TaxID=103232 RepID=UPI0029A5C1FB|nr:hypothetical protein [Streptomyces ipomoeae]MDX2696235.1 hypothetical protein [Streptomyces ipomoeae]MDX2839350.1 hypothetical protein [Streptomyces ipomoeae]